MTTKLSNRIVEKGSAHLPSALNGTEWIADALVGILKRPDRNTWIGQASAHPPQQFGQVRVSDPSAQET